jgi:CheY-like chemotaxis protein
MAETSFNVLIVDDNEMNRDTLARRLRQQGFASSMAINGREALEKVKEQNFDLILLDIMMPEVDGFEVLQTIRSDQALNHVPIIMISAMEEIESVMKCMELGAEDYLTKPFDPVLLQAAIARCLKKSPVPANTSPSSPPLPPPPGRTNLQVPSGTEMKSRIDTATSTQVAEVMPLDEVVTRVLSSGRITRKGYRHLTNSLYHALFNNRKLSEADLSQLNLLFTLIQSDQVKIAD